ncbi:phage adaptor protein [Kocuria sp. CPCC 205274]
MGDLKKAISLWSNRDDPEFLDQCHNFINFAEKDI